MKKKIDLTLICICNFCHIVYGVNTSRLPYGANACLLPPLKPKTSPHRYHMKYFILFLGIQYMLSLVLSLLTYWLHCTDESKS